MPPCSCFFVSVDRFSVVLSQLLVSSPNCFKNRGEDDATKKCPIAVEKGLGGVYAYGILLPRSSRRLHIIKYFLHSYIVFFFAHIASRGSSALSSLSQ